MSKYKEIIEKCKHENIMVYMYDQTKQEFNTKEKDPQGWMDCQELIESDYHPIEGECLDCGKELIPQELADLIGLPVVRIPDWEDLIIAKPK